MRPLLPDQKGAALRAVLKTNVPIAVCALWLPRGLVRRTFGRCEAQASTLRAVAGVKHEIGLRSGVIGDAGIFGALRRVVTIRPEND